MSLVSSKIVLTHLDFVPSAKMIKNVHYSLNSELISNILLKLEIIFLLTKSKIISSRE